MVRSAGNRRSQNGPAKAPIVPDSWAPVIGGGGMDVTLHESEEMLKELQKTVGVAQLAGGIAEHFNSMLATTIEYANGLRGEMRDDDPLRPHLDRILSSSERTIQSARNLLAFSGQQRVRPKPMDLNEVLRRVERILPSYISGRIEVDIQLSETDLPVSIDPFRIEEVLVNLITNANDSMPYGGKLTLNTRRLGCESGLFGRGGEGKAACALLSVKDTGTGMEEKVKERIFKPFFTTKERSIGLGLPVAYYIIKQHNGSINVNSALNEGTAVNMYLPLINTKQRDLEPIPLPASPEG